MKTKEIVTGFFAGLEGCSCDDVVGKVGKNDCTFDESLNQFDSEIREVENV
jgi:hypothetical protein